MKTIPEVLDQLPETADQVYAYLAHRKVKGSPSVVSGCPLAVHLGREVGFSVTVGVRYAFALGSPGLFELPPGARKFVEQFDAHTLLYPKVIA